MVSLRSRTSPVAGVRRGVAVPGPCGSGARAATAHRVLPEQRLMALRIWGVNTHTGASRRATRRQLRYGSPAWELGCVCGGLPPQFEIRPRRGRPLFLRQRMRSRTTSVTGEGSEPRGYWSPPDTFLDGRTAGAKAAPVLCSLCFQIVPCGEDSTPTQVACSLFSISDIRPQGKLP